MTVTATIISHRPVNYSFHSYFKRKQGLQTVLQQLLELELSRLKVTNVVTGLNYGGERALYNAARSSKIDYQTVIASKNEFDAYPEDSAECVQRIISREQAANKLLIVGGQTYSVSAIEQKMIYLINSSDIVFTVFNGRYGHTLKWLNYAKSKNKIVFNIYHIYKRLADEFIDNNFDEYIKYLKQFEIVESEEKSDVS